MTCLLCGSDQPAKVVNEIARNETPQRLVCCGRCGFVQADPMPTAEALADYYASGRYRREFPALPRRGVQPGAAGYEAACDADAEVAARSIAQPGVCGISRGDRVVEIGCGDGRVAAWFARLGAEVEAWDVDPGQRSLAAARFAREGLGRAQVSEPLPWAADVVVALQVLEHQPDPLATLRGWRSLLKDGGRLHVQVPTIERMYGGPRHFFQWPHVVNFTTRTLGIALIMAGFREVRVGISGQVLCASAVRAYDDGPDYDTAASEAPPVDDVVALIARGAGDAPPKVERAAVGSCPLCPSERGIGMDGCPHALVEAADVQWLSETLDQVKHSLGTLCEGLTGESRSFGESYSPDPFLRGYAMGCSREAGAVGSALSAVANALVVRLAEKDRAR